MCVAHAVQRTLFLPKLIIWANLRRMGHMCNADKKARFPYFNPNKRNRHIIFSSLSLPPSRSLYFSTSSSNLIRTLSIHDCIFSFSSKSNRLQMKMLLLTNSSGSCILQMKISFQYLWKSKLTYCKVVHLKIFNWDLNSTDTTTPILMSLTTFLAAIDDVLNLIDFFPLIEGRCSRYYFLKFKNENWRRMMFEEERKRSSIWFWRFRFF